MNDTLTQKAVEISPFLGNNTGEEFGFYFVLSIIGGVIYTIWEVGKRDKEGARMPYLFDGKKFFMDNWQRWTLTLIFTYLTVRFDLSGGILGLFPESVSEAVKIGHGQELAAVIIGLGTDRISAALKKIFNLQVNS